MNNSTTLEANTSSGSASAATSTAALPATAGTMNCALSESQRRATSFVAPTNVEHVASGGHLDMAAAQLPPPPPNSAPNPMTAAGCVPASSSGTVPTAGDVGSVTSASIQAQSGRTLIHVVDKM